MGLVMVNMSAVPAMDSTTATDIDIDSDCIVRAEAAIPKCSVNSGPALPDISGGGLLSSLLSPLFTRDAGSSSATSAANQWTARLKEEYRSLLAYMKYLKSTDNTWFTLKGDESGTKWSGTAWIYHENLRYEFAIHFEIPVGYPSTPPEICIPSLEGKTYKMYRGGRICMSVHFLPLWQRNVPAFGIAHAMALGLSPWLAAEVPMLIAAGVVAPV